jgi:hypothetical protein
LSMVQKENVISRINPNNFVARENTTSTWWWNWSSQSICTPKSLIQSVRNVREFPSLYW